MVSHVREGRGGKGEAMAKSREDERQEWVAERVGGWRAWRSGFGWVLVRCACAQLGLVRVFSWALVNVI